MDFLHVIGIALGLSVDAFAVAVTNGIIIQTLRFRHAFRIALFFGLFQAIMPVIGWAAGATFAQYIKKYDHWIAFGLLFLIGLKMIWESGIFRKNKVYCADQAEGGNPSSGPKKSMNCLFFPTLLLMSVSTSIDALAVGVTFSFIGGPIFSIVAVIGIITFLTSFSGVYIGDKVGHLFEDKLEIFGGLVLIGIGTKILIEHLLT